MYLPNIQKPNNNAIFPLELAFNLQASTVLHLDLNSCFATIEQQANPLLRGKPIAVAAYDTPNGCILAPSIEAKRFGIKTGMRIKDARVLFPKLIVLLPDPWKYRVVHLRLRKLLKKYTNEFYLKSIDEFVLHLEGYPAYKLGMHSLGREIKERIKAEIGEWLTVSVGIAPNRFLAKTAASLHKPDGLDEINKDNFLEIYKNLKLIDLCGISTQNAARLVSAGIYNVTDMYKATIPDLKRAFNSILGYYWYTRLRGWEIDDVTFARRSYGNSYALPRLHTKQDVLPILTKLVEKMSSRMRKAGYLARGVHLSVMLEDYSYWHKGTATKRLLFDCRDIYKEAYRTLQEVPNKAIRHVAVSCFNLEKPECIQPDLFGELDRNKRLIKAMDKVNERFGSFVISSARMMGTKTFIPDRIAFGGIKELEEFTRQ